MKYIKISTLLILTIGIFYSCKHEDDSPLFASTRPYIQGKYFETEKGASLYAAAFEDFAVDTQAYSLSMRGTISFLDTSKVTIQEYGHVWSTTNNPTYHPDSVTIFGGIGDTATFYSTITGLKMLTIYYVRSYIKLSNGEIGYNPKVTEIQTITDANIWIPRPSFFGTARRGAFSFTLNDIGFIGCGDVGLAYAKDVWSYDPSSMGWAQMASFPSERGYAVAFVAGGKAFAGLGENLVSRLGDFYEYKNNSWVVVNDDAGNQFPGGKRTKSVGFGLGNFGYVGTGDVGAVVNDFRIFDLAEYNAGRDPWEPIADIGIERKNAVSFVIGERAYVALGVDGNGNQLNDIWEYLPQRASWKSLTSFPGSPREGAFAFSIWKDYEDRGEGYVGGGYNDTTIFSDVYMFIPEENNWKVRAEYEAGPIANAAAFSATYQRENESFPTMKGFVTTGYTGIKLTNLLFEFLP